MHPRGTVSVQPRSAKGDPSDATKGRSPRTRDRDVTVLLRIPLDLDGTARVDGTTVWTVRSAAEEILADWTDELVRSVANDSASDRDRFRQVVLARAIDRLTQALGRQG